MVTLKKFKLNNIPLRDLNLCSSLLLALIVVVVFLSLNHHGSLLGFIGSFILCYGFTHELELSIWAGVVVALLVSWTFYPPSSQDNYHLEKFTNPPKKAVATAAAADTATAIQKLGSNSKGKGENLLDSILPSVADSEFDESQDLHQVDQSATLQKVFDGLDTKTLQGLTEDSKRLMSMQNQLFKTLKTVEPMLSKGAGLIEQFRKFIPKA